MKKAKIFLTGLGVLVVVGCALAFKVRILYQYAICDIATQTCILNPFRTFATTLGGVSPADYDVYGNCCVNNTCTTLTTFSE